MDLKALARARKATSRRIDRGEDIAQVLWRRAIFLRSRLLRPHAGTRTLKSHNRALSTECFCSTQERPYLVTTAPPAS